MAVTILELNTINKGLGIAKRLLDEIYPYLTSINIIYDAEGGMKETITQEDMDSIATLSGLTKAQLDDGMYVLTNTLRLALTNAYAQLTQLAVRV